jgi:P-type E1-E2 ATPase
VGLVDGHRITVTGRKAAIAADRAIAALLPEESAGLECVVLVDDQYAAALSFRDEPREGAREFVAHLGGRHGVVRTMLLSGDRSSEVSYLADRVGLSEAYASVSPERKLEMVRAETALAPTVFLGDGINDAPAMTAATVGIAFGKNNDVTAEAADAVVLDSSLERLDELMHIGRRMRRIALQSAIGGIVISAIGMLLAVMGLLPPIAGAISQEVIDVLAIANASRVALLRRPMSDFRS